MFCFSVSIKIFFNHILRNEMLAQKSVCKFKISPCWYIHQQFFLENFSMHLEPVRYRQQHQQKLKV